VSAANDPDDSAPTRVAVITGASRGIGAGLVTAFRTAGYAVLATARSMDDDPAAAVSGDISEAETALVPYVTRW
jgi:NAD(P)-dependent dehydrogenase (short-subunit alcohol dehydrogenase family)